MAADEEEAGTRHRRRSDDGDESGPIANGVLSRAGSRREGGWGVGLGLAEPIVTFAFNSSRVNFN